ncbi:energy-coupling factor transporter transmembrane protein EcfT [Arthrobacter zhaoxinii]|uniref:Energy-coupling factor transporter transmembrane protein EcfT n=1 Tax=Arthrobacter zhaoxinii TaxID=2964616 RepID=A0ABY5YNW2_9MICC|nr:energy-coupling factor transporter transmembrane component T [Arthrobacter zhaoxinii]UWX95734.1 energy-coupling factor transporter transmembrane protein EcfT [Arthrobacter zhaoxinii]
MKRSARSTDLLAAYRRGTSPVHTAPLGLKVAALVVLSVAVLVLRSPVVLAVAVVLVVAGYTAARLLRMSWQPLRSMWPILVLLGAFQWWASGAEAAVMVTGNIVVCVTAARLLTLTTPPQDLLEGLVSLARPLRPLGADPERFGLTLALMLRSIPFLLGSARDVRESAMARGLERNPRALTVPVVIRAVAYARQTGDALAARGIGERTSDAEVAKGNR